MRALLFFTLFLIAFWSLSLLSLFGHFCSLYISIYGGFYSFSVSVPGECHFFSRKYVAHKCHVKSIGTAKNVSNAFETFSRTSKPIVSLLLSNYIVSIPGSVSFQVLSFGRERSKIARLNDACFFVFPCNPIWTFVYCLAYRIVCFILSTQNEFKSKWRLYRPLHLNISHSLLRVCYISKTAFEEP